MIVDLNSTVINSWYVMKWRLRLSRGDVDVGLSMKIVVSLTLSLGL